ncbi:MAG: helix-turn-helix domain-containing protein [Rhodospirillum sp.]|nr:helix-turn-helix domain-containing protein [Rhodospirillum sp.]MCF8491664.1 helix-turn-helix domain-containing protein [Rhodospirillum sp.]
MTDGIPVPILDPETCYRALSSRDVRFDGRFFTCVTTTGIFCRPICPARTPAADHCHFVRGAAEALAAGYRPCLRCRPETAPGLGGWLGTEATVNRALRLIAEGALDGASTDDLAGRLGVGERHLRRLFRRHLGTSPGAVARARRLLLAKALLTDTDLPLTEVALASGFGGLRRFQAAIQETYGRSPGGLRRAKTRAKQTESTAGLRLRLTATEPHDWEALRGFLATRTIPGVERITEAGAYERTLSLRPTEDRGDMSPTEGRVILSRESTGGFWADLTLNRWDTLSKVLARFHGLLDLGADPEAIAAHLGGDPHLASRVAAHPGLRVPGCWDPFELAVRAVLGQQISVAGATTLAGRLVARLGKRLEEEDENDPDRPNLLFPGPEALAGGDLSDLGLTTGRMRTLSSLARAVLEDPSLLEPGADPRAARARLESLPGIGPWTAHYIALRAFRDPDAFPVGDLGLLRALEGQGSWGPGRPSPKQLAAVAETWRPWRAYAALYLWIDP